VTSWPIAEVEMRKQINPYEEGSIPLRAHGVATRVGVYPLVVFEQLGAAQDKYCSGAVIGRLSLQVQGTDRGQNINDHRHGRQNLIRIDTHA